MTAETRHCHECKHSNPTGTSCGCTKGHKPRCYVPQTMRQYYAGDWGYKRRCADFEPDKAEGLA